MKHRVIQAIVLASCLCFPSLSFAQTLGTEEVSPVQAISNAYAAQQWTEAVALARAYLETMPDDTQVMSILGASLAQLDQNEQAETIYLKLKEKLPNDPSVFATLCYVQSKNKRAETLETCTKAIQLNPNRVELLNLTARELEAAKKLDEAHDMYVKAWELDPKNLVYLTAATSIDFRKKDYQKAFELTQKGIEAGNTNPILYINIINALNRLGRYEDTITWADKGMGISTDKAVVLGKAEALYYQGRFEEARKLYEENLNLSALGTMPRTEYVYAKTLIALACTISQASTCQTEQEEHCCQDERTALDILKRNEGKGALKDEKDCQIYLGLAHILNGDLDEAEAILTQASKEEGASAVALAALSAALYQYGDSRDVQASVRYYRQALDISPELADVEFLRKTRAWPLRVLDILQKVQRTDQQPEPVEKASQSGCGCETQSNHSPLSLAMILCFLATLLGMLHLRRKSA